MEDTIKLKSRGRANNYLKKLNKPDNSESKTYVLKTSSATLRTGTVDGIHKFIDPSGGPMIVENNFLEEAGAVVEFISFTSGIGYIISFK